MTNKSISREESVVMSVMMTSFFITFIGSSVNLALPLIGKEFGGSALVIGWIVTAYILSSAAFLLPMGRIADIAGRKMVFFVGTVCFTFFTFLCAVSWSCASLVVFRVLQGVSASMIYATGMAIVSSAYPMGQRGKAVGLVVTATYTGLSLGPALGGLICRHLGWRGIFYFTAVFGIASVVFIAVRVKNGSVLAKRERFDITGSILYICGLAALIYGMSSTYSVSWARYVLSAGIILITCFVLVESKTSFPLINIRLFLRNTVFAFSNLAAMINYSATFAIGFLVSLYLQLVRGYPPHTAGFILLAQPIIMALFSSFAGSLSDRIEPRFVASFGMLLNALGLFIFVFIGSSTPVWIIVANLALIGFGFALFSSPNTNAIMGSVDERFYGIASSTVSTMRMMGMATSMAVVTLVMAIFAGDAGLDAIDPLLLLKSFKIAFAVFAVLCVSGVFASFARGTMMSRT